MPCGVQHGSSATRNLCIVWPRLLTSTLLAWALTVDAQPYGRGGAPAKDNCAPSYTAMEPDARQLDTVQFPVEILWRAKGRHTWDWFTFPVDARCREARLAVLTVLGRLPTTPGLVVNVGDCR